MLTDGDESVFWIWASVIGATDVTLIFDFLIGTYEKTLVGEGVDAK